MVSICLSWNSCDNAPNPISSHLNGNTSYVQRRGLICETYFLFSSSCATHARVVRAHEICAYTFPLLTSGWGSNGRCWWGKTVDRTIQWEHMYLSNLTCSCIKLSKTTQIMFDVIYYFKSLQVACIWQLITFHNSMIHPCMRGLYSVWRMCTGIHKKSSTLREESLKEES